MLDGIMDKEKPNIYLCPSVVISATANSPIMARYWRTSLCWAGYDDNNDNDDDDDDDDF